MTLTACVSPAMARHLLLISTSTVFGTQYLEHASPELRALLGGRGRVLFIPYALKDRDAYAARARAAFEVFGYGLDSIHDAASPKAAVESAEAVFCGGGNTFRLLGTLQGLELLPVLRKRVAEGMPYSGASAGANLACPTIKTTNDMPIVEPPSFEALGLVGFQINPHYLDGDPASRHMGETRETRIREFHEENETPVVGLREGAMLRIEDESVGCAAGRSQHLPARQAPSRCLTGRVDRGARRVIAGRPVSSRICLAPFERLRRVSTMSEPQPCPSLVRSGHKEPRAEFGRAAEKWALRQVTLSYEQARDRVQRGRRGSCCRASSSRATSASRSSPSASSTYTSHVDRAGPHHLPADLYFHMVSRW